MSQIITLVSQGLMDSAIEAALGLSAGAFDVAITNASGQAENAMNGAAVSTNSSITVTAPTTLTFDYDLSGGDMGSATYNDSAFLIINGAVFVFAQGKNGAASGTYTISLAPGTYSIGFAVLNEGDAVGDATLEISNIFLPNSNFNDGVASWTALGATSFYEATGGTFGVGDEDTVIAETLVVIDPEGLTNGNNFSIQPGDGAANGTATINPATGDWTYTPNPDFSGSDTFSVTVTDDLGNTVSQPIDVTVNPVDDPTAFFGRAPFTLISENESDAAIEAAFGLAPGSFDAALTAASGQAEDLTNGSALRTLSTFTVTATTTLQFDFNLSGGDLGSGFNDSAFLILNGAVFVIAQGKNGATSGTYSITLQPGVYSLGFAVLNEGDATINATLEVSNITVANSDFDPGPANWITLGNVASSFEYTVDEDSALTDTLVATDPDGLTSGNTYSIELAGTPAHGTAAIDPGTGDWTYTPDPNFNGSDSFTVTVVDDLGNTATQAINVTVNPIDDPTIFFSESALILVSADETDADIETAFGLQAGTFDAVLTAVSGEAEDLTNGAALGTGTSFTVTSTTTLQFDYDFSGGDLGTSFNDSAFLILNESVFVIAQGKNGATSGTYAITLQPGTYSLGFAVFNEGDTSVNGTLEISNITVPNSTFASGSVNWTPLGNFSSSFDYTVNEGGSLTTTLVSTDPEGLTNGNNFSLQPGDIPANGTATIDPATGEWTYTPNPGYSGSDAFTVTVTDDLGGTATEVINITVAAISDINHDSDINGDGFSDFIWRNPVTGDIYTWYLEDGQYQSSNLLDQSITASVKEGWEIEAIGDFDSDGKEDDLAWHSYATGTSYLWYLEYDELGQTAVVADGIDLQVNLDPEDDWQMEGVGDFDGDGFQDDIVWSNGMTGSIYIWYLENGVVESGDFVGTVDLTWVIEGATSFDGDGLQDDILWRNTQTGEVAVWTTDQGAATAFFSIAVEPAANWTIAGVSDFDGDLNADDILWHDIATGNTRIWAMDGVLIDSEIPGEFPVSTAFAPVA